MDDLTNAVREEWAAEALTAYNAAAPAGLLPFPEQPERVRLGIIAAEALARVTRTTASGHTLTDRDVADAVIGDLLCYAVLLAEGRATGDQLTRAAAEMRSTDYPVTLTAVCEVSTPDAQPADRIAAMMAAALDAAEHFGCDAVAMLDHAVACAEKMQAEEAAEEENGA
ncbi:hypothetical protein [Streptomyces sp. NBRC 110465]|uniref:hypothetical protein n=1 Tax=Streptomyces sp. NBRC 110465 TaxID=1897621 RepID=UPI000934B3D3|nr:hypothetical protein [Streptomyces sp. NBRC 110465]